MKKLSTIKRKYICELKCKNLIVYVLAVPCPLGKYALCDLSYDIEIYLSIYIQDYNKIILKIITSFDP